MECFIEFNITEREEKMKVNRILMKTYVRTHCTSRYVTYNLTLTLA